MRHTLILVALGATVALAGCGKAPEVERAAAEQAVETAVAGDVGDYAPDALALAEDTLNAARAAAEEQDGKMALFRAYGESKRLFEVATALAEEAKAQAATEKERVRGEVETLLTEVKTALDAAGAALAKAPTGKDNKAELALMKADLEAAGATYAEAEADYQAGNFAAAQSKLQAVQAKADQISTEVAAAVARKKS